MTSKMKFKDLLIAQMYPDKIATSLQEREFDEEQLNQAFALTLKTLRTYKKITLRALGEDVGMKPQTINRYENAENIPTIAHAMKLSSYFEMSIELFTLFGLANLTEGADITKLYENVRKMFQEVHRKMVIQRAKGKH